CVRDHGLGLRAREHGRGAAVESYYARVQNAIPNLRRLLEESRAAGILIVFVRTAAQTPDGRDLSPKLRAYGFVPVLGSRGAEILDEVAPRPGDIILNRPASSVCTGTGLDELLRNAGVETVIVAGFSFDGAIEGSTRSLTDRGYGLFLVPDACATYDEQLQEGLWRMQTGIINVASTDAIMQRLAAAHAVKSGKPG
ncbi:MAG: isochorismatase family cysteine hydrolase, partial [bacterium]